MSLTILPIDAALAANTSAPTIYRLAEEGFFDIVDGEIELTEEVQSQLDQITTLDTSVHLKHWTAIQLASCPIRQLHKFVRRDNIASGTNLRALKRDDIISLVDGVLTDEAKAQGIKLNSESITDKRRVDYVDTNPGQEPTPALETTTAATSNAGSAYRDFKQVGDYFYFEGHPLFETSGDGSEEEVDLDEDDQGHPEPGEDLYQDSWEREESNISIDLEELGWDETAQVCLVASTSFQTMNHHLEEAIFDGTIDLPLLDTAKLLLEESKTLKKNIRKYRRLIKQRI